MSDNGPVFEVTNVPGARIVIHVDRDEAVIEPGTVMSAAALDMLGRQMTLWVATRLARAMDRGQYPDKVAVSLRVKLDGRDAK